MTQMKPLVGVLGCIAVGLVACGGSQSEPTDERTQALAVGSALFVVGNTTLNSGDAVIKKAIEGLGLTVTVKSDSASAADATGKKLVVISSTVTSSYVGTKFKSVAVPLVTWESGLFDDLGMTSGSALGTVTSQTRLTSTGPAGDPMTAGLTGTVSIVGTGSTFSWGKAPATAVRIAALATDATRAGIFRFEKGVPMVNLTAPARRVGLFLENTTAANLNASGKALVESALRWAARLGGTGANCAMNAECSSG